MGRPLEREDCDDLPRYVHKRNVICSQRLLEALKASHPECDPELAKPVVVSLPALLPPIPNSVMSAAADIAFPKFVGRIEAIQRATLREFPLFTLSDLKSQRRTAGMVRARQIAMYLSKVLTGQSLPEIGRRFGGRDHTTVLHAVRKVSQMIMTNEEVSATVERIRSTLP